MPLRRVAQAIGLNFGELRKLVDVRHPWMAFWAPRDMFTHPLRLRSQQGRPSMAVKLGKMLKAGRSRRSKKSLRVRVMMIPPPKTRDS